MVTYRKARLPLLSLWRSVARSEGHTGLEHPHEEDRPDHVRPLAQVPRGRTQRPYKLDVFIGSRSLTVARPEETTARSE